jgi:hypothetical protein
LYRHWGSAQAVRPKGNRGIHVALPYLDHGTRRRWGASVTPLPLFTPGKEPVPIVQEAGWAPGPVWTGAKNLAPTGIRCPDRPARSQSLYQLSYPANNFISRSINKKYQYSFSGFVLYTMTAISSSLQQLFQRNLRNKDYW